jgi:hypothetical protein
MGAIFSELIIPRQILQAKVDESLNLNKHLPLVPSHHNDINICKPTSNLAKIGTSGVSGGQDSSPKSFKCG